MHAGRREKVLVTFNDNRPSDIMKTKSKISTGMSGIEAIEYLTREIQRNKIRGPASNDVGEKLFFKRRMLIEERKLRGLLALTGAGRFGKKSFAINSIVEYR